MDWIVIWLCVGTAMVYMGRRVWRMVSGKAEATCGGCGKACGCAASCSSQQGDGNAGGCGLRDMRK